MRLYCCIAMRSFTPFSPIRRVDFAVMAASEDCKSCVVNNINSYYTTQMPLNQRKTPEAIISYLMRCVDLNFETKKVESLNAGGTAFIQAHEIDLRFGGVTGCDSCMKSDIYVGIAIDRWHISRSSSIYGAVGCYLYRTAVPVCAVTPPRPG